jgi:hypothetical protein
MPGTPQHGAMFHLWLGIFRVHENMGEKLPRRS